MTSKSFEDHVQELWEYYKPVMDGIPTSDQILQGFDLPKRKDINHDQLMIMVNDLNDELVERYKQSGDGILFDYYMIDYINFLNWVAVPEIVMYSYQLMVLKGIPIEKYKDKIDVIKSLGENI